MQKIIYEKNIIMYKLLLSLCKRRELVFVSFYKVTFNGLKRKRVLIIFLSPAVDVGCLRVGYARVYKNPVRPRYPN